MQRGQDPIHNSTLETFYLINNMGDIIVFIGLKFVNFNSFYMFSCSRNTQAKG